MLENGQASRFSDYFDIDWAAPSRPELLGRVLLPILGEPYGQVLESQQLKLELASGAFFVAYFDHRFPIAPRTYGLVLGHRLEDLEKRLPADDAGLLEFQSILTAVKHLPPRDDTDPQRLTERLREKEVIKRRLAAVLKDSDAVREHLGSVIAEFNGKPGDPRSFDLLDTLLDRQPYRLSFWRVASDEINYRRFFDVNELAALSMEREDVFLAAHGLILRLLVEGQIGGVRIDHVDGLFDPRQYLERLQQHYMLACAKAIFDAEPAFRSLDWESVKGPLRERLADALTGRQGPAALPLYVVVEKILGSSEALPEEWPVHGTSGYEFLNLLNGLFVADSGRDFTRLYSELLGDHEPFPEVAYREKRLVMQSAMSSELLMLAHQLDRLAQKNRWSRDFTRHSLWQALREVIACFPVYRSYIAGDPIRETDRKYLNRAMRWARLRNPAISGSLFQFVRDTVLQKPPPHALGDEAYKAEQLRFAGKFQQVTSPVVAKGIEDTAFYVFNRLLSLNEVGGDPDRFGVTPLALHTFFGERQSHWPRALSTTATHDTKRGEDVRARLNVLSEIPEKWREAVARWSEWNKPHRVALEDESAPDANEEYFLYQTLLGAWEVAGNTETQRQGPADSPLAIDGRSFGATGSADRARKGRPPTAGGEALRTPGSPSHTRGVPTPAFVERIQAYVHKALHEAKVHSSWINPNPPYDEAMRQFVATVLNPEKSGAFLEDLDRFARQVSHYGLLNSLSQALVKFTAPGVPDTYQGTELWDFSLVDPDNRRPVDFERRARLLNELKAGSPDLVRLLAAKDDGRVKLFLTWKALNCRRDHPGLFSEGAYLPVEAAGAARQHVFSFIRRRDDRVALVVVPRWLTKLVDAGRLPLGPAVWGDTCLLLPDDLRGRTWRNALSGEVVPAAAELRLGVALANFPAALLLAE
ncbi:MAG: malto-oligosyltrehalose synthase [Gemmataceae bacterium]